MPHSPQPAFLNAVCLVETRLGPAATLTALLGIERQFGRVRRRPNEARVLDLDLIDWRGLILTEPGRRPLTLPHPRAGARAFVLEPLRDVAPGWRDPVTGLGAGDLLRRLGRRGPLQRLRLPARAGSPK